MEIGARTEIWTPAVMTCGPGDIVSDSRETGCRTSTSKLILKGRQEGSPVDDVVVEHHADHMLGAFKTQREAIDWARKNNYSPLVARVRHLNEKKVPDDWGAA
jgi:hypothetical protein